jgi:serine/threonine protein phosphatase PrpC
MTPRLPKKSVVTRALAGGLAALYFLTNVAAVHAAENNFWKDRRRAASLQWGEPDAGTPSRGGALYARLPTAPSQGPDLSSLWEQPVHRVSQDLANAAPKNVARAPDARLLAVAQAVAPFGQVRRVKTATSTTAPLILHIQDVHGNPEAQRNMSGMVLALAQKQSPLVGLEGAAGAFDIDSFHTYPDLEIVKSVADYFLEKDLIGGPEHAGLVATKPLTLWGVEDPALYHAHVAAVKESLAGRSRADALLGALAAAIDELKKRHYSPALLDYDQNQSLYEQDRRGLGEYVDKLKGFQKDAPGRNFPNIEKLLVAAHREKNMDFDAVENERRSLVEGLAARLSVPELQNLVRRSLDLKSGSLSQRDYQAHLRELCARHKLALTRFPRLVDYMIYVADSETIERDALLDEIARLESAAQDALAQTPAQRAVVSIARDLSRLAKLVANEMTPADWAAYEPRRNEIARLGDRVKAVDGGAAVTWPADWSGFVRPFEEFCRLALSRNDALANRTLEKMKAERKSTAILVAGGFHTDGLVALLAARGAGVAVLTPKIGPMEGASNYLDVFGRDPLPVEKIFAGEPIALKDRCGLGGGELSGEQTSRVHAAIAGQTLMVALEDLRGLGHSARTMLRELRERLLSLAQEVAGLALIQPRVKAVGVNGLTFSYRAPNGREESVDFRSTDEGVSVTGRRRTGPGAWWGGITGAVSRFATGLKRPAPAVGAPPVIGEGSFFQVRDPGQGRLAKEVKEIVGPRGDVQYKLSEADRERLAQLTAEYSDRLRESVARASGGRVRVPVFERIGRTLWVDKAPGGPRTSETPGDRDLYLNAMRGADIALGLESLNDPIYTPDGWRIHVDRKFEGFYFSETSPEVVWIDPVTVWPPADRRVGPPTRAGPLAREWGVAWRESFGFLRPLVFFRAHATWNKAERWVGALLIVGLWGVFGETAMALSQWVLQVPGVAGVGPVAALAAGVTVGWAATVPLHAGWNLLADRVNAVLASRGGLFRLPRLTIHEDMTHEFEAIESNLQTLRNSVNFLEKQKGNPSVRLQVVELYLQTIDRLTRLMSDMEKYLPKSNVQKFRSRIFASQDWLPPTGKIISIIDLIGRDGNFQTAHGFLGQIGRYSEFVSPLDAVRLKDTQTALRQAALQAETTRMKGVRPNGKQVRAIAATLALSKTQEHWLDVYAALERGGLDVSFERMAAVGGRSAADYKRLWDEGLGGLLTDNWTGGVRALPGDETLLDDLEAALEIHAEEEPTTDGFLKKWPTAEDFSAQISKTANVPAPLVGLWLNLDKKGEYAKLVKKLTSASPMLIVDGEGVEWRVMSAPRVFEKFKPQMGDTVSRLARKLIELGDAGQTRGAEYSQRGILREKWATSWWIFGKKFDAQKTLMIYWFGSGSEAHAPGDSFAANKDVERKVFENADNFDLSNGVVVMSDLTESRVKSTPAGALPRVVEWLKARGNDTAAAVRKAPLVESGLFSVAFLIPFVMAIMGADGASWAAGGTFALMNAYFGLQHKRVYRFQNGQWVEGPSTWKTKAWLMGVGAVVHAPLLLLALNPLAGPIGMMGLYMAAAMASVDLHWIYNRVAAKFGLPAATVTFFDVTSTGGMPETRRNILMTLVTMETTVPEWISRIANMSDEEVESSLQRILLQDPNALSKRVTTPDNVETFVEWIRQELTGSLPQPHAYALALTRFVAHAAEREKTGELATRVAGDLLGDLALRRPAAEKGWGADQTKNIKARLVGINDLLASLRTPSKEGWEEIGFWLSRTRQFESQEYERLARSGSETSPIQKLLAYQKYLLHPARPGPIHGSLAVQLANEVLGQFMSDPARAQSLLSDPLVAEDVGKIVSFAVLIKIAEKTGMNEDVFLRLAARAPSFLLGVPSPSTGLSVALEDLSPESHRAYRFVAVAAHRWMEGYVLAEIPEMAQSPAREPLLAFLGNLASHDVQAQFPPAQGTLPKILGDTAVPASEARTAVFRYSEAVIGALSRTPYSPLVHVGIALQRLRGGVPQTWNEGFRNMMAAFFPNATPDSVAERTAPGVTVESSVLAVPQTPMNLDRSEAWLPLSGLSLQRFPLEEGARHLIHNTVTDRFIVAIRQGSVLRLYQQADSPGAPAEELVLEGDQLPGHPGLTVQWNPAVGELGLAVDPLSDQAYTVQPGPLVESIENYARDRVKVPGNVPTIWNERVVFEFDKAGRFTGIRPLRSGEDGGVRLAFNPLTNLLTVGTVRAPSGRDLLRGLEIPLRGLGKTSPESAEGLSPLWVEVHSLSSVKHPTWNEDSHFEVQLPNGIHVSAVFDGVGGQAGGEAASREASELVKADIVKEFGDQPPQTDSDIRNALEAIVQNAHTALLRHNDGRATTVVLSVSIPRGGGHDNYILEVGDSRAYWVDREGGVLPITVDSFRSEEPGFVAPRAGPVPAAYAEKMETQRALAAVESKDTIDSWFDQKSPLWEAWIQRKFIEQGLGGRDEAGAPLEVAPGYFKVRTEAGEKILLTSDGVHDNLTDQEIATHLAQGVESLVKEAHRRSAEKSAKDGLPAHVRSKADDVTALVMEAPGRRPAPAAEPIPAPVREGTLGGLKEVISGIFRRTKEPAARPLEWRGEWMGDKYVLTDGGEGRFELPVLTARGADGAPLPADSFPGYMDVIVNGRRATSYKGAADDMTFEKTVALIARLMQTTTASWAFPKILGVHRVPGVAEPRLLIESFPAESSFENIGIRRLDANLDAQLTEIFTPEWVEKFRLGRFNLDRGLYMRHFFLVNGEVRYRLPVESYALESFFEYFQKMEVPPAGAVPGIVRWLTARGQKTAEAIQKAPLVESGLFSAAFLVPVVLAVFGVDGGFWAAGGVYALMNAYFGIKHGTAYRFQNGAWQEGPADAKTRAWLAGVGLAIHAPLMLGALATPLIGPVGFLALYPFLAALSVGAHRAYNVWAQNRGWAAATIAGSQSPEEQARARAERWHEVLRLAFRLTKRFKGEDESLTPAEEALVVGATFEQIHNSLVRLADPNPEGSRIRKALTTAEREKLLWFLMGELRITNDRLTQGMAALKQLQDENMSNAIVKTFPPEMARLQSEIEMLRSRAMPYLRLLSLASEGADADFEKRHVEILSNFLTHPAIDINFRETTSAFLSSRLLQNDDGVAAQALFDALVPPGVDVAFDRDALRLSFTDAAPPIDKFIETISGLDVNKSLDRRLGLALISLYRNNERSQMRLLTTPELPMAYRLMALHGLTMSTLRTPAMDDDLKALMASPVFVKDVLEYLKSTSDDRGWFQGLFENPLFAPEDGKAYLTAIAVVLRARLGFTDFASFARLGATIDRAAFLSYWEGAHSQMSFGGSLFTEAHQPGHVFAMVAAHETIHALLKEELDYYADTVTAKRLHEFLADIGADVINQELRFGNPDAFAYARLARFFSPPVPGVESAHERARRQLLIFNDALNQETDRARFSPVEMLKGGVSLIRRGGASASDPNRTFANLFRLYAGLEPLAPDEDWSAASSFLPPGAGEPTVDTAEKYPTDGLLSPEVIKGWLRGSDGRRAEVPTVVPPTPPTSLLGRLKSRIFGAATPAAPVSRFKSERVGNTLVVSNDQGWAVELPILTVQTADGSLLSAEMPLGYLNVILNGAPAVSFAGGTDVSFEEVVETLHRLDQTTTARAVFPRIYGVHLLPGSNTPRLVVEAFPQEASFDHTHLRSPPPEIMSQIEAVFSPELAEKLRGGRFNLDQGIYARHFYWVDGRLRYRLPVETYALKRFFEYFKSKGTPPAGAIPGVVDWLKARGNDTADAIRKAPWVESGLFSLAFVAPFVMAFLGVDGASWAAGAAYGLMNAYFGLKHDRVYRSANGVWSEGPSTWKTKVWLAAVGAVIHAPLLLATLNPLAGPVGSLVLYGGAVAASVGLHRLYNTVAQGRGWAAATVIPAAPSFWKAVRSAQTTVFPNQPSEDQIMRQRFLRDKAESALWDLIGTVSPVRMVGILQKTTGLNNLELTGNISVEYFSEGVHKYVFKVTVERVTPQGVEPLSFLLAMKKSKVNEGISVEELNDLQRLRGLGAPLFGGSYFAKRSGEMFFLEEFIEGPTAQELKDKGLLTNAHRKMIASTLSRIGDRLDGNAPSDSTLKNFIIRSGVGPAIMVDLGSTRSNFGPSTTAFERRGFLFGVLRHLTDGNSREEARAVVDGLLEGLPEAKARVFVTALASEFRRLPPTNNPALTHAAAVLMEKEAALLAAAQRATPAGALPAVVDWLRTLGVPTDAAVRKAPLIESGLFSAAFLVVLTLAIVGVEGGAWASGAAYGLMNAYFGYKHETVFRYRNGKWVETRAAWKTRVGLMGVGLAIHAPLLLSAWVAPFVGGLWLAILYPVLTAFSVGAHQWYNERAKERGWAAATVPDATPAVPSIRSDLRSSVAELLNAGPNTWVPTGLHPQGEILYTRGLSGRFTRGDGAGLREAFDLLSGSADSEKRYVSLPGSEAESLAVALKTNSLYGRPLTVRGRVAPDRMVHVDGTMTNSLETGATVDSVDAFGFFLPVSGQWQWARSYVAFRQAAMSDGIAVDPSSRGAQFAADLESALNRAVLGDFDGVGREVLNPIEVEDAVAKVMADYATANSPSYGPVIGEGSFFTVTDAGNGELRKEVKEIVGPPTRLYRLNEAEREKAAALIVEHTNRIRRAVNEQLKVRNREKLANKNFLPYLRREGRSIFVEKVPGLPFSDAVSSMSEEMAEEARRDIRGAVRAASEVFDLKYDQMLEREDGWRIGIDNRRDNFLFVGDDVSGWIDAISPWPPETHRVQGPGETLRTNVPAVGAGTRVDFGGNMPRVTGWTSPPGAGRFGRRTIPSRGTIERHAALACRDPKRLPSRKDGHARSQMAGFPSGARRRRAGL